MNLKLPGLVVTHDILLTRCFIGILGSIAICWGIVSFPIFWQQSSIGRIAGQVIAGYSFKTDILTRQLPIINSFEKSAYCYPTALESAAIIQLRIVEAMAFAGVRDKVDPQMKQLNNSIRTSLKCSPAEPFLWLVLYSIESTQNGFKSAYLNFLKMSYQLGPNEGWIALKRNPIAFTNFERLPSSLAADTINEFVALLKMGLYKEAADILSGPAWQARDMIIPHLAALPRQTREAFASAVYERGLDVAIPEVNPPNYKPWLH